MANASLVSDKTIRRVGSASFLFALLQSICTAILTINAVRVAIGVGALVLAGGIFPVALAWHQAAIRIPMLVLATLGALVSLGVLAWIRHLRSRPSAEWRSRDLTPKEARSEHLQIAMAVLTLVLVALELWSHPIVNRPVPPPNEIDSPMK